MSTSLKPGPLEMAVCTVMIVIVAAIWRWNAPVEKKDSEKKKAEFDTTGIDSRA